MTQEFEVTTMEVRRDDWASNRFTREMCSGELQDKEVLFKVDRFALTANNISYCSAGDSMGYWGFFPAAEGWGRVPVMGYADVIASANPFVPVGERVWGFFPISTHLKITAGKVRTDTFVDTSAHRAQYAPAYSQFQRCAANPTYKPAREDQDSLLRGLFLTSWLCEDFMTASDSFGAGAYVITSASSKTSIALAYMVRERGGQKAIGLTSAGNVAFCQSLGCYDEIVCYDDIGSLDASRPVVLVDMAGDSDILSQLHHLYSANLKYSCRVGATHHDKIGALGHLPGATPEFFFAPAQIQKRSAEWGADEVQRRMSASYVAFRGFCDDWLTVVRGHGVEAVAETYLAVLAGQIKPNEGHILSLWPA